MTFCLRFDLYIEAELVLGVLLVICDGSFCGDGIKAGPVHTGHVLHP